MRQFYDRRGLFLATSAGNAERRAARARATFPTSPRVSRRAGANADPERAVPAPDVRVRPAATAGCDDTGTAVTEGSGLRPGSDHGGRPESRGAMHGRHSRKDAPPPIAARP